MQYGFCFNWCWIRFEGFRFDLKDKHVLVYSFDLNA